MLARFILNQYRFDMSNSIISTKKHFYSDGIALLYEGVAEWFDLNIM